MGPPCPRPPLFPYTTLFRSATLGVVSPRDVAPGRQRGPSEQGRDRKSTRLNSSHVAISYAVFCLKKKKRKTSHQINRNRCKFGISTTVCRIISDAEYQRMT